MCEEGGRTGFNFSSYGRPIYCFIFMNDIEIIFTIKLSLNPFLNFGLIISYKTLDMELFEALGPSRLFKAIVIAMAY